MSDVHVIRGCKLEYIDEMSSTMREMEKTDFARSYPSVRDGLIECCLRSTGGVNTVKVDGELAAIYGVAEQWGGGSAFATPWMAVSEHGTRYPMLLLRMGREQLRRWKEYYQLIHNLVPAEDEPAIRLLRAIGFKVGKVPTEDGYLIFSAGRSVATGEDQCAF